MVRGKTKIKAALKIIRELIGDSILVAHNASFDYGFLNEAFKNNNEPPVTNPIIDTLALSWYLFPTSKRHSLGGLCRQFDVDYDDKSAHRANYDAEVLNTAFQAMLVRLTKDNP
jgi:DNA polymerase-3 subunit alpha (Gram-positive type)